MIKKQYVLAIATAACSAWALPGSAGAVSESGEGDTGVDDSTPHELTVLMEELNAEWTRASEACLPAGSQREVRLNVIGDGHGGARVVLESIDGDEAADPAADACLANELDGVEFGGVPHISGVVLSVVVYVNGELEPGPEPSRGECLLNVAVDYDDRHTQARVLIEEGQTADIVWSQEEGRILEFRPGAAHADPQRCAVAVVAPDGEVLAGPFLVDRRDVATSRPFMIGERSFELTLQRE